MATDFRGADLSDTSILSPVVLGGEVKERPNFAGVNLSGSRIIADFPGTNFSGANLTHAHMQVNIKNQGMGQMRNELTGANFSGANLSEADFGRSMMDFTNLTNANLRNTNFYRVNLSGSNLSGADITGADFTEAILIDVPLRDAKGLDQARGLINK